MQNNKGYRFSRGKEGYITFDQNGYILEAKGFNSLMWSKIDIDEDIIGKHVDELVEMLKRHCITRDAYLEFEANVHVELLKKMLSDAKK